MSRTVLFLQCTNAGQYPPIMNAARLMANAGWDVVVLSSPSADTATLEVENYPGVRHIALPMRLQNAVRPREYIAYVARSVALAAYERPNLVYASDALSALPALSAAKICRAKLIYHEHDTPSPNSIRPILARWRAALARRAELIVLPQSDRARLVQDELRLPCDRIRVVWNVPCLAELPVLQPRPKNPLVLYYHGNISPILLPLEVIGVLHQYNGRVRLRFAGYEAPSAVGYIKHLIEASRDANGAILAEYLGQFPRSKLLQTAATANIGLAVMPMETADVNMRHMVGASNKGFDYMAAGLPLIVSDLPEWRETFVEPGFAVPCRPDDATSISTAIGRILEHPELQQAISEKCRKKIENDWNYDNQFRPILEFLDRRINSPRQR